MKRNKALAFSLFLLAMAGVTSMALALEMKTGTAQPPVKSSVETIPSAAAKTEVESSSAASAAVSAAVTTTSAASTAASAKTESAEDVVDLKVSTVHHDAPDGKYYIDMDNILQRPELPTGCEATSLTIVLNHFGFSADKCDIVDNYLPKTNSMCSLNNFFIGDPYSDSGLGCNAPVIVKTADSYLTHAGSKLRAQLLTGSDPETLYWYVSQKIPVMCWATIGMIETEVGSTWKAEDTGETVDFMENEHCTVLVGYDSAADTVMLNDPWNGDVTYPMSLFEEKYHALGDQAVIIS